MRLIRDSSWLLNPSLGVSLLLLAIIIAGVPTFGFDAEWIIISLGGLLALHLGVEASGRIREGGSGERSLLLLGETITFLLLSVSFGGIAGHQAPLLALLWLITLNLSAILVKSGGRRFPLYSLTVYSAGILFTVHSFAQYGSWAAVRSLPLTPPEGAFGMFLIFISFPSILQWLVNGNRNILSALFIALSITIMLLHGFRADAALIILSTFLILWRRYPRISYTFILSLLALFLLVDVIRTNLSIPVSERPIFRLSTTYYYSKEVLKWFSFLVPPQGPLWILSIPLHPSQSIGRGIFGKEYGITPTMFVGLSIASGIFGMLVLSAIIGLLAGYSYRLFLRERDMFSYAIIWPLLITRVEIGMSQLDLTLVTGSVVFAILANLFNGEHSATPVK